MSITRRRRAARHRRAVLGGFGGKEKNWILRLRLLPSGDIWWYLSVVQNLHKMEQLEEL